MFPFDDVIISSAPTRAGSLRANSLRRRHNGHDCVSNHQPHDCLLNRIFRRRSKKISKLRVTGLCVVNSPETGEFPAQMASNAENVSIWWRHHILRADKGMVTPGQLLASCGRLNSTRNGAHKSGISCVTLNNSFSPERTNSGSEISLGTILSTASSVIGWSDIHDVASHVRCLAGFAPMNFVYRRWCFPHL